MLVQGGLSHPGAVEGVVEARDVDQPHQNTDDGDDLHTTVLVKPLAINSNTGWAANRRFSGLGSVRACRATHDAVTCFEQTRLQCLVYRRLSLCHCMDQARKSTCIFVPQRQSLDTPWWLLALDRKVPNSSSLRFSGVISSTDSAMASLHSSVHSQRCSRAQKRPSPRKASK